MDLDLLLQYADDLDCEKLRALEIQALVDENKRLKRERSQAMAQCQQLEVEAEAARKTDRLQKQYVQELIQQQVASADLIRDLTLTTNMAVELTDELSEQINAGAAHNDVLKQTTADLYAVIRSQRQRLSRGSQANFG